MSPLWYLVLVVAVVAVAAVVLLRRRAAPSPPSSEPPAVKPAPPAAAKPTQAKAPVERKPGAQPERAAPTQPVKEPAVEPEQPAEAVVPVEVAKPELSADELRERVETSLEGSERLLEKLQGIAGAAEGEDRPVDLGMLEIMREGLEEVRSLAQRKKWSQAKDKGEALHAQLSLMLRGAGRESPS